MRETRSKHEKRLESAAALLKLLSPLMYRDSEALVNALTHRDYRVPCTSVLQVIRYQDRIEVRNPGYSLVDDEQLGEPGSFPRNPRISDVFREMRLAENKGTGVAAIRRAMHGAGLTPPFFEAGRRCRAGTGAGNERR